MTNPTSRRDALKCLGVGAGTLFTLSGGVFSAFDIADAQEATGQAGSGTSTQGDADVGHHHRNLVRGRRMRRAGLTVNSF